jgi:hypothetical protein
VIVARRSFTGSIVHSLQICEENYWEKKKRIIAGETKAKRAVKPACFYSYARASIGSFCAAL